MMAFSAEDVSRFPPPGLDFPTSITFGIDNQKIFYLKSVDALKSPGVKGLYCYDIAESKETLIIDRLGGSDQTESLEEQLRKQRLRQMSTGITEYMWSSTGKLLIPSGHDIYILDSILETPRLLVSSSEYSCIDPKISPDGKQVSFVSQGDLYVVDINGGTPIQITSGDAEKTRGLADYVAQEEMQRRTGYWWSPNSSYIAFTEVDERSVSEFNITHLGKDSYGPDIYEQHRYPFSGDTNPEVRLGVVEVKSGNIKWVETSKYEYIARVDWIDGVRLFIQLQTRSQKELQASYFDVKDMLAMPVITENNEIWINLHDMFRNVDGNRFIWASERSGYMHLYLYSYDGSLISQITSGEWQVDSIAGINTEAEQIYFLATLEDPRERHLYSVDFNGNNLEKLTFDAGMHSVFMNSNSGDYVDVFHNLTQPPTINLRSIHADGVIDTIFRQDCDDFNLEAIEPPEMITIKKSEDIELYGAIFRPSKKFGTGPFPTIVSVYGGPHAQMVTNGWNLTVSMRAQYLRSKGFLVLVLDNMGSARRGLEFESVINRNMGDEEIKDQVLGLNWLISQGIADENRIGIYGWSYGGYMALMCLAKSPSLFKAAVSGAPVTSWDGYDTHYTERYMGTPETNEVGYTDSSVMTHVKNIKGQLLIVHGLIDENVHFRHTARLINSLIEEKKQYKLLIFPDERHMPRKQSDRSYMETEILEFFLTALK